MVVGSLLRLMVAWILYNSTVALSCPQFGSDLIPDEYSPFTGLFLNQNSPSQCHGNVTQWEFCYSRSRFSFRTHEVQFMVYRQNGQTLTYNRIPGSFTTFRRRQLPSSDCTSLILNQNEVFKIQPNDILAVCMRNEGNTAPLEVTSRSPAKALQILTADVSDECQVDQLLSLNFGSLRTDIQNVILVKAIINSTVGYRIGHNPASSASMSTFGIFINTEFPAQSNGLVTSYNYCYYTDSVSLTSNYSAIFAVWRNDSQSSNLTMVAGSSVTVTLQPQFTIAAIHCQLVELEPENHFIVMEGDYVGVALPLNNSIPIIGSSDEHELLDFPDDDIDIMLLESDSFGSETGALHLYADIISDTDVQTTTQIAKTGMDSSTTIVITSDETTSVINKSSTILHDGIVVAIIIVMIIILLVIGIAGAILTFLIIRQKRKTIFKTQDPIRHHADNKKVIGNNCTIEDHDIHLDTILTTSNVAYHKLGKDSVEIHKNISYQGVVNNNYNETDFYDYV